MFLLTLFYNASALLSACVGMHKKKGYRVALNELLLLCQKNMFYNMKTNIWIPKSCCIT